MDFGNTKYYNQKKRVITLRKGRGKQAGYVTLNGARIVSRRPTVYYVMNSGAIRALTNANTSGIPSALKYKVLKAKAPKKVSSSGNAPALNAAKNAIKAKRIAGLVKARQVKANKAGFRALPGFGNNQNSLFNNNLAKKANKKLAIRAKKLSALEKARAAKKMHAKNLPGWYNTSGNLFGPTKANRPNKGNWHYNKNFPKLATPPSSRNSNAPFTPNASAKSNAASNAANQTANKLASLAGVNVSTANAAANAAAAAAASVTPSSASNTKANTIANAAANGAAAAVQALPVNERKNKNAVAAAAAAGASQAANAAKNGNSTVSEAKNIGAAAGTAVKNTKAKTN
jgi:hypothetical protein